MATLTAKDPVQHVVVLMLENRSFDQMLGAFQSIYPNLDGIIGSDTPRSNLDPDDHPYHQRANASRVVFPDPHHSLESVLRQIEAPPAQPGPDPSQARLKRIVKAAWNSDPLGWARDLLRARKRRGEPARGMKAAPYQGDFVGEFVRCYPKSLPEQRQQVMSYFDIGSLPALHELARHFTICDRWFSSLPGPTWANRFFLHCGTARGTTWMPSKESDFRTAILFDQETVYDRLTAKDRSWRIYFHDFPQALALSRLWTRESRKHFSVIYELELHAAGNPLEFPDDTVIEPQYAGDDANDDHPPYDSFRAQALVARVYNAIRSNAELWATTLLVVVYDEHGGFYDHVQPPATICSDGYQAEYSFEQLGVRVPALLISPWLRAGVWSEQLDHTSVGKYTCDKWGTEPLGERMKQARSLQGAIQSMDEFRNDTPERVEIARVERNAGEVIAMSEPNENQLAIMALSDHLDPARPISTTSSHEKYGVHIAGPGPEEIRSKALRFLRADE